MREKIPGGRRHHSRLAGRLRSARRDRLAGRCVVELACAAASQAHWMATISSSAAGGSSEVVCVEYFSIVHRVVAADVREGRSGDGHGHGHKAQATTLCCVVGDDDETEIYSEDIASAERVLHASGKVSVVREDGAWASSSGKAQSRESSRALDRQALSDLAKQAASSCDRSTAHRASIPCFRGAWLGPWRVISAAAHRSVLGECVRVQHIAGGHDAAAGAHAAADAD